MNSLLVSASAPNNLWGGAILSACHLQNRISYKKTGKTPYESWKGHAPNLKYLKVWGCFTKVMLPDPKKRKIGSKTSDCMFIPTIVDDIKNSYDEHITVDDMESSHDEMRRSKRQRKEVSFGDDFILT